MAEYSFKADGKSYNLQTSKEYSNEEIENLYEKFSNGEKLPENVYIRPTINNRKPIIPQVVFLQVLQMKLLEVLEVH